MRRFSVPSVTDVVFLMIAPIFAIGGAVRLTQSDGDLAAHIRMGEWILAAHRLPQHSLGSYTAAAEPLVAPAWLSEVLFALLYQVGGLPLIAVITGMIVALTHAMIARFLLNRGVDPRLSLLTALVSLFLGASHWLARPHMLSILGAALTIFLLESKRPRRALYFFPLFALWANLHGGWLFGLLLIAAWLAGDLGEAWLGADRSAWMARARGDSAALGIAAVATLMNPYIVGLYREALGAVTSPSLAANIDEYMPPGVGEAASLPFFAAIVASAFLLVRVRKRLPLPWMAVSAMSLFFALRASRNIAFFGVTAVPLIALHLARSWPAERRRFPYFADFVRLDAGARLGAWAAPVAILLLALGLNRGKVGDVALISDRWDGHVFPVAAVRRAQEAGLTGRIFHPWLWGGYLLYAWPGSSLHVDPLKFSEQTIDSHTRIESLRPGWKSELDRWNVELVIVEPESDLATALSKEPRWSQWYRDSTAVILRRAPSASVLPPRAE